MDSVSLDLSDFLEGHEVFKPTEQPEEADQESRFRSQNRLAYHPDVGVITCTQNEIKVIYWRPNQAQFTKVQQNQSQVSNPFLTP